MPRPDQYQMGPIKNPTAGDKWYDDEMAALNAAVKNSAEDVMAVWDYIGCTLWLVYEGEIFRRFN